MAGSLLLNSNSLKDLLLGVNDVRKRKVAAARSEEMVGAILRQDAVDNERAKKRLKARTVKRRANKKRSLLERTGEGTGLQRARVAALAFNNVFEYGRAFGLDRDSIDSLERQFMYNELSMKKCLSKLKLGVEQLSGTTTTNVSPADADLLLSLVGLDVDEPGIAITGLQFPTEDRKPSESTNNQATEAETAGAGEGTDPDKVYRRELPEDESPGKDSTPSVPFPKFERAVESYVRNKLALLNLAEVKGYAPKNATERFLNKNESLAGPSIEASESALFASASELEVGGQMDSSLYDTQPHAHAVTFQDSQQLNSTMFVSSVNLPRPSSDGQSGHPAGGSTMSNLPRVRLEYDSNVFSQSDKGALPPLRLGRSTRKQRKELGLTLGKRHFTKAGFDASFTRSTPRVLQSKPTMGRDLSEGGGATQAEIDALRWELTVAREGIKHLDKMVDTNIAWVQSNCDMSVMAGNFSQRTKQKCQNMATERIAAVLENWVDNNLYWAVRRWQTAVRYDRLTLTVKQFTKLKGIERLTTALWKVITNQMLIRGWQPWLRFVQAQILKKMNAAAIHIQRIVRGKLGRVRFNKIKLGQVAITLQKLFRKTKAIAVIKEKRFVREQELNNAAIRAIQKLLTNLIKIRLAKAELQKRREEKASIRIQKIHRGRAGRKKFLEEWMKRNAAGNTASTGHNDLEQLASAAEHQHHDVGHAHKHNHGGHHESHTHSANPATTHDTHKRSLFHSNDHGHKDEHEQAHNEEHHHPHKAEHRREHSPIHKADAKPAHHAAANRHGDKTTSDSSHTSHPTGRKSLDKRPDSRPITPGAPTVSNLTAASDTTPSDHHRPKPATKKTPPPSAHAGSGASGTKVTHRRSESPNSMRATKTGAHGSDAASHGSTSTHQKTSRRVTEAAHRKSAAQTPVASTAATPSPSRPASRPASAMHKPASPGGGAPHPDSPDLTALRNSYMAPVAPAPVAPSTVESAALSEKLTSEAHDDDLLSSEAMALMLQRQNSATKIQNLLRAKTNKPSKRASVDASAPSKQASKPQPTKRRSYAEDATSTRSGAAAAKSTRQSAASVRKAASSDEAEAAINPEDAIKNIQKVARGKLARARSKKLLEEKERQASASEEGGSIGIAPSQSMDDTPGNVGDALEMVRAQFTSADSQDEVEGPAAAAMEEEQSESDFVQPSVEERPRTSASASQSHLTISVGASSNPTTPKPPLSSKPSSPMLASIMPTSFLSSFHLPGFSLSRPTSQQRGAAQTPPPQVEERASSSFFRNPFASWGSRSNSRESTPVKQRPDASAGQAGPPTSFKKQSTIPEHLETAQEFEENDRMRQEMSVKLIQARARGMRDRQRVAQIKEEREALARAEEEAQEKRDAAMNLKPATAPSPQTNPLPAKPKTPTAVSTKAPARRASLTKQDPTKENSTGRRASFDKEGDKHTTTGRRTSFDKSQENSIPRRGSFGDKDTATLGTAPRRTPSNDHEERSTLRRASFDREKDRPAGTGSKPSTAEDRSSSTGRRASFDKEKGLDKPATPTSASTARSAALEREHQLEKSGAKTVHVGGSKPMTDRSKPSKRMSAPAHSMDRAAAAAAKIASSEPLHEHHGGEEDSADHGDVVTPAPQPVEGAEYHAEEGDEPSEMPDFTGASGMDHSLVGDSSAVSDSADVSVGSAKDASGFESTSSKPAPHDKAAGSAKERARREKEEAAKAAKEKANAKKKEAEDKRKADAAKAKAARDDREASTHGGAKKPAKDAAKGAKPAAPKKADVKAEPSAAAGASELASPRKDEGAADVEAAEHSEPPTPKTTTPKPAAPTAGARGGAHATAPKHAAHHTGPPSKPTTPKTSKRPHAPALDPEKAAAKIQSRLRVDLSKKKIEEKKQEIMDAQKKLGMLVHWAVITIQRNFRGRRGRKRYAEQHLIRQVELAQKKEASARKIQARSRGILGRKKANFVKDLRRKERQELEWMESYQKTSHKKINLRVDNAAAASPAPVPEPLPEKPASPPTKARRTSVSGIRRISADGTSGPAAAELEAARKQAQEMAERMQKLEEMEREFREKAEKLDEITRAAQARDEAMAKALALIEEQTKKAEADRLAQQQLLMMAAGPMSHRSDFASPYSTQQRRMLGSSQHQQTMPLPSSRRSVPNSSRVPDAPPTARSARGGAGIPPDAARMTYNGEEWVQLWDPDEAAYYWYCERTQFAQWDAPGTANNASAATMVANYYASEGDDSGYESAGAMTDYSTDHYDENSVYTDDSGYDNTVWHEYWDESAQAKYWYNEITGEASWTKPESASAAGSEDAISSRLAITNGYEDQGAAPGNPNEWVSYIDEDTEQAYWYNVRTGETSWA